MSTHKNIDRICVIMIVISVLISFLFMNGEALGVTESVKAMGYENRLFDTSKVHSIDVVIDDWDTFLTTCQSEEYSACALVIDGEAYKNIAIRGKGNTSLSNVASMDSSRYSFKIEFDHYDNNKNYYGLDKLCLNNIIQDNTYMKDYLAYQMMNSFGVDTPLCSYAYITVNGEDWGLYLAVESVEDGFLERNYGNSGGELYKPDSMSFGGGRGNGKEFNMDDFKKQNDMDENDNAAGEEKDSVQNKSDEASDSSEKSSDQTQDWQNMIPPDMPEDFDGTFPEGMEMPDNMSPPGGGGGMPGGGMGSSDVKLQYIDDDADSYSNIFDNAKTDITNADKKRLISSLKSLSENKNIDSIVNVEEVIRYFVVHNFVVNGDSYTGSMIHNYYLYEKDGQMSMIPWDYNLAFGTFQSNDASGQVNSPIDSPVSGDMSDRPMVNFIFSDEKYTELYHQFFSEFLSDTDIEALIDNTAEMISSYVEKDPTKFCTYEEFKTGVNAIKSFCALRAESIQGQLRNTIPSTSDGQSADSSTLVDASSLNLSDMGTMNMGGGKGGMPDFSQRGQQKGNVKSQQNDSTESQQNSNAGSQKKSSTKSQQNSSTNTQQNTIVNFSNDIALSPLANTENNNAQDSQGFSRGGGMPNGEPPEGFGEGGGMPNGQPPEGFGEGGGMPNGQPPEGWNGEMPGGQPPEGWNGEIPDDKSVTSESNVTSGEQTESQNDNSTPSAQDQNQSESAASDEQDQNNNSNATPNGQEQNQNDNANPNGQNQNRGAPDFGNMKMPQDSSQNESNNTLSLILLGVSAVFLAAGLIFAFKFKR